MALLACALLGFTGCVMETDMELGHDWNELDGADEDQAATASLTAVDPCDAQLNSDPELTIALPRIMDTRANPSALPDSGWYTNALIQNTSSGLATVRLRALAKPGAGYGGGCTIFSLGSKESVNFRPDNPGLFGTVGIPALATGNFEGSMLIETDQPLAVVAQLSNVPVPPMGKSGGTATASYMGLPVKSWTAETGGDIVYPIMKSGFNGVSTTLFVQNVDRFNGDWVDLVVRANAPSLNPPYDSEYRYSTFVQAGRSVAIYPWQFKDSAGSSMPAGCTGGANPGQPGARCIGSVQIESRPDYYGYSRPVAAIAVEHPASGAVPKILANHFERVSNATRVWFPDIKNQYLDATSGIAIMNLSRDPQNITVTLRQKDSTSTTYSHTFFGVGENRSVVASPFAGTFGGFPAGTAGIATITSPGPIAAVVNETKGSSSVSSYHGQSVFGNLAAPLIKLAFASKSTRVTLWNVGSQAVQIVGDFKCRVAGGSTYSNHTHTMTAGAGIAVDFQPNNIPAGNLCSAIFTTTQKTLVGSVTHEDIVDPSLDRGMYEAIVLD
jgi:hypothetical protein